MSNVFTPMQEILKSIDKDIETHTKKATEFLTTVHTVLFIAIVFAVLYLLPGIAERALPSFEKILTLSNKFIKSRRKRLKNFIKKNSIMFRIKLTILQRKKGKLLKS